MKTAFVTGATGFLGLNLIECLRKENWLITALHLPGEDLKYLSRFNLKAVSGNILDFAGLEDAMPSHLDAVFHLAGDTSMWSKHDARQHRINVEGTANMCRAAIAKKAVRFIHTSSSSAFGYHGEVLSEQTVSNALECGMNYNKTKFLAELEVKKAVESGLFAVILNSCNIIGPFDPGNWSQLIQNTCRQKLPGYPPGVGTFSHVRDIAHAHISAVENGGKGENYLLGGVEASFKEVMLEIIKTTGVNLPLKEISRSKLKMAMYLSGAKSFFTGKEPMLTYPKYKRLVGRLVCNDAKARKALGFKTTSIFDMVSDCHQWLRQENLV
ncbi:MAG: NAD-dependent epimerase/dehydratase family protein [Desulfobacter sp.]|nr:MAG: NAD-dependent epimerase/dehydratase family protein [Desulfobacter sp.]